MGEVMVTNPIPARQNEEAALKLMRARQWTYLVAMRLMGAQIVLTVMVPVAAAVTTLTLPDLRPYFAAIALVALLLDTLVLDQHYKTLLKRAAKLGEKFDCIVLDLHWNSFVAGEVPETEDIHTASQSWLQRHDDEGLRDWYPVAAGEMPMALARVICQRTNLRYDSQLRRSYSIVILVTVALVLLGLFAVGLVQDLNFTDWILALAPGMPLLSWAGREYYRQRDTADALVALMGKARGIWQQALDGNCDDDECRSVSRELQNAIYLRRSTAPLVMPRLYKFKRLSLEDEMNNAASNFLEEYRARQSFVAE
jgi:SMODS-associating 4TM effector domain